MAECVIDILEILGYLFLGIFYGTLTGIFVIKPLDEPTEARLGRYKLLGLVMVDAIIPVISLIFSNVSAIFGYSLGLCVSLFVGLRIGIILRNKLLLKK